jgi:hypothetical protein
LHILLAHMPIHSARLRAISSQDVLTYSAPNTGAERLH